MADTGAENVLNTYLAEYNSLRAEQLARLDSQNQAFNFLMIVLGAAITAVITIADKTRQLPLVLFSLTLLLPLITTPLCFIFFDNEIAIHAIGSYLYWDLRPRVIAVAGISDGRAFESIWDFKYLSRSTAGVQNGLSQGRLLLFLVPTLLPVLGLLLSVLIRWLWWKPYLSAVGPSLAVGIPVFCLLLYAIDVFLVSLLLRALWWTFHKHD